MYDLDQTIELLQRAVAEKGDGYAYERVEVDGEGSLCLYRNTDGKASCIVGHVLSYVELLGQMEEHTTISAHLVMPEWSKVPHVIQDAFTEASFRALQAAQDAQDLGETWGEALIAAKEVRP